MYSEMSSRPMDTFYSLHNMQYINGHLDIPILPDSLIYIDKKVLQ